MFSGDFFLLHSLGWQLLQELRERSGSRPLVQKQQKNQKDSDADLHAGLLGGSRRDLGVVVGLRGLRWEPHHRGRDGGWRSVVIRDLSTRERQRGQL